MTAVRKYHYTKILFRLNHIKCHIISSTEREKLHQKQEKEMLKMIARVVLATNQINASQRQAIQKIELTLMLLHLQKQQVGPIQKQLETTMDLLSKHRRSRLSQSLRLLLRVMILFKTTLKINLRYFKTSLAITKAARGLKQLDQAL